MPDPKQPADLGARLDRIEALLSARIPQIFDPPPDDWGRQYGPYAWRNVPVPISVMGPHTDPVPIDLTRLSRVQLQLTLETIKAQRVRLDAVEKMVNEQLGAVR